MASPVGELQRILYVEDDADIRAVAELALETGWGVFSKELQLRSGGAC